MTNRVYCAAAVIIVVLLGYGFSQAYQAKAQDSRQPFTMIWVSQESEPVAAAGQEARAIRRLIAVRSDGSNVTVSLPPEGDLKSLPEFGDRAVMLRPQRQQVHMLDRLKLKTTLPLDFSSRVPPPADPPCLPSDGGRSKFVGTDTILGWPVYVYESSETTRGGTKLTNTRWLAPALNCRDIQGRLEIRPESGAAKTSWNRTVSITPGEPDPALFVVPEDYREVSPGEMERERAKFLGRPVLPPAVEERLKSQDEAYFRARSK